MIFALAHFVFGAALSVLLLVEQHPCGRSAAVTTGVSALFVAQVSTHWMYVTAYASDHGQQHTPAALHARRCRFVVLPRLVALLIWIVARVTWWEVAVVAALVHVGIAVLEVVGALTDVQRFVVGVAMVANLVCALTLSVVTWTYPCVDLDISIGGNPFSFTF